MEREPLNAALFAKSADIHRAAERRPFQVLFLKAQLTREQYVEYLGRLSFVYEALERADEALKDDPVVGRMHAPELYRSVAIDGDMTFFAGPDWGGRRTYSPATRTYVERIEEVARDVPPAFVAHQWLRYMGNVMGQKVILGIMERSLGMTDEGTAFYRYDVGDPREFLKGYHARLNSMPLDDATYEAVVNEGRRAFQHQIDFTDELGSHFGITGADADEADRVIEELAKEHP